MDLGEGINNGRRGTRRHGLAGIRKRDWREERCMRRAPSSATGRDCLEGKPVTAEKVYVEMSGEETRTPF